MGRVSSLGTYGTERAAVMTSRFYKPDASREAVIQCHGLNAQAWHPVHFPDPVLEELVARGFPVITPDLGGTATWGNDIAQQKILDAKTFMQDPAGPIRAKPGPVLLWCGSMGTLAGLNFLRANPTLVLRIGVGLPAVDLADLHDNAAARALTSNATIETAYTDTAGYNAARAAHNPSENTAAFQPHAAKVRLWYSADDPTVIPGVVTAFAAGTGIPAVSMGNQGGHVFGASFARAAADFLDGTVPSVPTPPTPPPLTYQPLTAATSLNAGDLLEAIGALA